MTSLIDQIEQSKENLQPLKQGRKTAILSERLQDTASSEREHWVQGRRGFEEKIMQYKGTDPLEIWYDYIKWIQQSKLSGIGSDEVLGVFQRCTKEFLNDARYKNDPRYCRIWIQYADLCQDPSDVFAFMKANSIAVGLALFWTSWSFVLDLRSKNYSRAWDVLEEGIRAKAAPIEKMRAALKTFQTKICEGMKAKQVYPNFTFEDQENARKVLAEIDSTRRVVSSASLQQQSIGSVPDVSSAKPKFAIFSDTAGHASGDVHGKWMVLPSEKERTKENLQKPVPMAGSVLQHVAVPQTKTSTIQVFEDAAPAVPHRGPAPQPAKGVLETKKMPSVQPDQPTKFIQEGPITGKIIEVSGYSRDLTVYGNHEISLEEVNACLILKILEAALSRFEQARCINKYGVASITTSAPFEHAHMTSQEESQGQAICICMEDDEDAMVLDLDSSSASIAGALSSLKCSLHDTYNS
jgi:checkpoint serine/threonine-protein kinase